MPGFIQTAMVGVMISISSTVTAQQVKDLLPEWTFTKGIEGPSFDKKGNLYAVNIGVQGTIGVISPEGVASCYVVLPQGSVGNGIRFDKKGYMYIADYPMHNILQVDPATRRVSVFAHNADMNQPNDIAIAPKSGIIYASDPDWKESTGKLWMIDISGRTTLLEDKMGTTNGIEVSPDGKLLYVNESIKRVVWVYDIIEGGKVSNKRVFYRFDDFGMDGMRCDKWGNLFITRHGKGTVVIISPDGKFLKEIALKGKLSSNIALSIKGRKVTCYVTMADRGCFEFFTINHKEYGKE